MRIAIDITQVIYGTGVSTYTRNLVRNLLKIDKKDEFVLFGGYLRRKKDLDDFVADLKGNFETKFFPIPPTVQNILWNYLHILDIDTLVGKIDLFHSSDWSQPPTHAKSITTVHDLVPLMYPKLSDPKIVYTHKKRLECVRREVDRIIVPSQATKKDLVSLDFDSSKIVVISEAPDTIYEPASQKAVERILRKYRISGKYLLSVGITPRKNTDNIISAYEKAKTDVKYPLKLVIVGHQYMKLSIPRGVEVLGHVESSDMPALYSGAEALVYPSLYEGFGLPILEAFACKTPVVTSDFGSMAEVAGNAASLVDAKDAGNIADGILRVIKDRDKYVHLGYKQSKKYKWTKVARETLEQYNSTIG